MLGDKYILVVFCLLYLIVYSRRMEGERTIEISCRLEKILFPFSKKGKANLISIAMAVYLQTASIISYVSMFVLHVDMRTVNYIWLMGMLGLFFIMMGVATFYEISLMRGKIPLKFIMGIIGILMVLAGLICMAINWAIAIGLLS